MFYKLNRLERYINRYVIEFRTYICKNEDAIKTDVKIFLKIANQIAVSDTIYLKPAIKNQTEEKNMDFKQNEKYFRSNNTHFYIGIAMLAVGVALVVLQRAFWLYFYLFTIGLALAVIGALLAFVPKWGRSSDKDIDEQIKNETDGYLKKKIDELALYGALSPNADSIVIAGYIFDSENALVRRGLDGKIRASEYSVAAIIITKNSVVTSKKTFSLTDDRKSEETNEFLFTDTDRVEVTDRMTEFHDGKNNCEMKTSEFVIYREGINVFRAPTAPNALVESAAENINMLIKRAKAEN